MVKEGIIIVAEHEFYRIALEYPKEVLFLDIETTRPATNI
jgi:hypothetical protein